MGLFFITALLPGGADACLILLCADLRFGHRPTLSGNERGLRSDWNSDLVFIPADPIMHGRAAGPPAAAARGGTTVEAPSTFDPKRFLATVNHGRTLTKQAADSVVFAQGDPADSVFYVQKGRIKLVVESEQGKEAVVAILSPDEFFGEGCLIGQPLRLATARAMVESEVMRVSRVEMIRVLHDEPAFGELFTAHLLIRNSRVEADLVDQLFNSSEKRLARALLMLANFGKEGAPQPITTKISQETLAEIIGTTRSRVSFFMNKFRKLGFIDYNGHIEVHSSLLSVILHD
jgi:CRP/FNR family transcriptional regulator, cyclic AMP receptor protein